MQSTHLFPRRTAALLIALAAAGCSVVGPDFVAPEPQMPAAWHERSAQTASSDAELSAWWKRFGDPQLDRLVSEALAANRELAVAEARVREARALRDVAAGGEQPSVGLGASAVRSGESSNTLTGLNLQRAGEHLTNDLYRGGVDASWEIDLFGGIRRNVEAAQADAAAAEAARVATRIAVAADTAAAWFDLRGYASELAAVERNLGSQQATARLVRDRRSAGLAADLDVARAEAQVASTSAALPPLRAAARQAAYRLDVLRGVTPGSDTEALLKAAPLATPNWPTPPEGVPAELLRRRPDILRAEAQLAAATARVGVAEAELYPKLTLSGSLGLASISTGNLSDYASKTWSFGPALSLPIFEGGRLRSAVKAREAGVDAARASYEQTVLSAVGEVETAAAALRETQARRSALLTAQEANRRALGHANDRYGAGLASFLDVLDAQRTLFLAETELARADREVAADQVRLHKALGHGW